LKQRVLGQEIVQEVELVEGRGHPGQKSWILRFRGIDTEDQVRFTITFVCCLFCFVLSLLLVLVRLLLIPLNMYRRYLVTLFVEVS
jgi:hypothetical protein